MKAVVSKAPTLQSQPICLFSAKFADNAIDSVALGHSLHTSSQFCKMHAVNVFFSGVLYNLEMLRHDLKMAGGEPAEIVAALYTKYGHTLPQKLDGAYAIVIVQGAEVGLLRDREGLESLYYYRKGSDLIISNSIKKIKSLLKLEVSSRDLAKYFVLDQINDAHTLFKNVFQVKLLEYLKLNLADGRVACSTYDELPYQPMQDNHLTDAAILSGLEARLSERIGKLVSAFPGSAVVNTQSGGTDSALTQCLLKQAGHNRSICANFSQHGLDGQYSEEVACHLGSDHRVLEIGADDFFHNIRAGIETFELPLIFEGESMFQNLYREIGRHTSLDGPPVLCFDSNGADAILGHGRLLLGLHFMQKWPRLFSAVTTAASTVTSEELTTMLQEIVYGVRSDEMTPEVFFAIFNLKRRIEIVRRAFGLDDVAFIPEYELAEQSKYPVNLLERMYRLQIFQYEVKRINNITYNLARQHNVITLYPFRDRALTQFFLNIPTGRKIKRGVQKYYGKKLLQTYLPRNLVYRKKISKGIPFAQLFQEDNNFAPLVREIMATDYPYFDFDVATVFNQERLSPFAMKLINFHIWHEIFVHAAK